MSLRTDKGQSTWTIEEKRRENERKEMKRKEKEKKRREGRRDGAKRKELKKKKQCLYSLRLTLGSDFKEFSSSLAPSSTGIDRVRNGPSVSLNE